MTAKFPKSDIEIVSGRIDVLIHHPQEGFQLAWNEPKTISMSPLKQSKSGVYCLRNKLNGRLYIGMASNLERRKWRHINDLKKGVHPSKTLQFDYNESRGFAEFDDTFIFEVIIYAYPSQLTFWESILISSLDPYYNTHKKNNANKE